MKSELKQVADNATQLNHEERTQLIRLLKDIEELFDANIGEWGTETINMELNPDPKPFNYRYYPVPIIKN